MPRVHLINETYDFDSNVTRLISYVYCLDKTAFPQQSHNFLIGMAPDIICSHLPGREKRAALLFHDNHRYWGKLTKNLVHHIVVSFETAELSNACPAWSLAQIIAQYYFASGFFCCFGVHTNTDNIHIHLVIDNISYVNGNSFFIPAETVKLQSLADRFSASL